MTKWMLLCGLTLALMGASGYLYLYAPPGETAGVLINPQNQSSAVVSLDAPALRMREIILFVGDAAKGALVRKPSTLQRQPDLALEITTAVQQLIHPTPETRNAALPEGTEVLNVFVTKAGVAYLNVNRNIQDRHSGGLSAELATVTALVNTLLFNFKEIKQVQILVEGAEIDTLAGHLDCRKPFAKML